MGIIDINVSDTVVYYGPYDVTDYATWKSDLEAGVNAGSKLFYTLKGNKIIFREVKGA